MAAESSRERVVAFARRAPVSLVLTGVALQAAGSVLVAVSRLSGLGLSFWRFWVSLPILAVMAGREAPLRRSALGRRALGWGIAAGTAFAVHQVAFLVAIKRTSVVDVALVQVLQPVLVGLAAIPLFGERSSTRFRAWSAVGMAGAALVVLDGSAGPDGDAAGMGLAVVGVSFFVAYFLISKQARPLMGVATFLLTTSVVATVWVSLLALVTATPVFDATFADVGTALAIALMGGIAGHYLITWPLRDLPVNLPPVIQLAFPFVAGSLAWLTIGESVTSIHLAGGALTIAGVLGAVRSRPASPAARSQSPATRPFGDISGT